MYAELPAVYVVHITRVVVLGQLIDNG